MTLDPTTIPTSSPVYSYCYSPQSLYVDYPAATRGWRLWRFVYDRLLQAAEWVYDNKL